MIFILYFNLAMEKDSQWPLLFSTLTSSPGPEQAEEDHLREEEETHGGDLCSSCASNVAPAKDKTAWK